ncbi:MAG: ABC transporter substrate-binding protein [Oscillospiraceae bacterium]
MKKVTALLLLTALLLSVTACTPKASSTTHPASAEPSRAEVSIADPNAPITVTDQAGRTVTTTQPVNRIAVCWYMANDFVLAMDLGDKLVAAGPRDDFQKMVLPALNDMDTVGKGRPDMEKLAAMKPDLFIHTIGDKENREAVDALGIPMILIDPETIDKTLDAYQIIGEAVGKPERAQMLNKLYHSIVDKAQSLVGSTPETNRPTFVLLGKDSSKVANGGMMQAEMLTAAGGVNLAQSLEGAGLWPEAGTEQVFAWDPNYLFISSTSAISAADLMKDPAWADLQAVKNGKVYQIPGTLHHWENPGMATCLGTLWAANKMYPGTLSDADFDAVVTDFYKTVYGLDMNRETLGY